MDHIKSIDYYLLDTTLHIVGTANVIFFIAVNEESRARYSEY